MAQQIEVCASDIGCDAVKTGMLANAEIIDVVAAEISARRLSSLVVDPVMIAKSGARLLKPDAIEALNQGLSSRRAEETKSEFFAAAVSPSFFVWGLAMSSWLRTFPFRYAPSSIAIRGV